MTAQEIRKKYLEFMQARGHKVIPPASLVPQDDPTTLFTGSGMQPLIPYLLGQPHPEGKRLVDSQPSFRAQDIEEVGDNRHTTFFEMLGNWSLGDYFKTEQLPWFFEFLTEVVGLDPKKLYVTCFMGDEKNNIPKDPESPGIWKELFAGKGIDAQTADLGTEDEAARRGIKPGERIFFYAGKPNWWCRNGKIDDMPVGEPGGPSSEVFYEFDFINHDPQYGEHCHPNCDCGRFLEIGNSVFMEYVRSNNGFEKLPKRNVDFGGGLERIAAAQLNDPDVFKISLIKPVVAELERLSAKKYAVHTESMRVIADHLRGAVFLVANGVTPSNKERGYVLRRLLRRAIRYAFDLGIEQDLCEKVAPIIIELYAPDYPEVAEQQGSIMDQFIREERLFRQTLRNGLREFDKITKRRHSRPPIKSGAGSDRESSKRSGSPVELGMTGQDVFELYDTFGFPVELTVEETYKRGIDLQENWKDEFEKLMDAQRERSHTASAGMFKGGLADHSEQVVKYHTTTHLMYKALKEVLGPHVVQRGSNITKDRTRFDFSHSQKMTPEEIKKVEDIVNEKIAEDLPVTWREENTKEAFAKGASGAFGDKYGETVKVYTIGDPAKPFSREICGGPHVEHTGVIGEPSSELSRPSAEADAGGATRKSTTGEGGKRLKFKIVKEEASSAGVRRIKAVLQ